MNFSVVIPVHNFEPFIATALDSVLGQAEYRADVIVVDDGSTDGTSRVLRAYGERIRVITQDYRGVAAARNKGIEAARGEFIAFLDADDWWLQEKMVAQFSAIDAMPSAGLLCSEFRIADERGHTMHELGVRQRFRSVRDIAATPWDQVLGPSKVVSWSGEDGLRRQAITYCGDASASLFQGNFICMSSVLVRKAALERAGGFDETLTTEEDYDCWLKIAEAWPVAYMDTPLVVIRRHAGQLTASDRLEVVLRNVAHVVERASDRMADKVDTATANTRLSIVYRDLGIECLRSGKQVAAVNHFFRSLARRPWQPLVMALLPFGMLPGALFRLIERGAHAFRRLLRGSTR